jgi:hypothetical protein
MRILNIDFPGRLHVPDLEREAYNQMPKVGWRELKLYLYANTDLYQWYGKKGINSDAKDWSVFEDPCDGPFQMTPESGAISGIVEAAKVQEADRLINILINAALDKREEEIINAALYRPNPEPESAGLLHGKPATAQQLIEANRNAGNITLQEFVDTILSPAMERLKSKHPEYTPEPSLWRSDPGKEHTMSPGSTGRILSLRFMIIYPGSRVSDLQLIKGDAGDPNIVVKIPNEVLRKIYP